MKKLNRILMGGLAVLTAAGCSQNPDLPGWNPDGETIRIRLDAPEALQTTRAVAGTNSARGGLTNVDWERYDLRYQIAVYSSDGSRLLVAPQAKTSDTYGSTVFEFRLTPNNTYKFVAWADFVAQGTSEDLHYDTSDFTNITTRDALDAQINDESRDAYFISSNIAISQTFDASLTLKRPFAKIRVVTTDWDEANGAAAKPDNFRIAYHDCERFAGLNAVTGEAVDGADADASTVYTGAIATDQAGGGSVTISIDEGFTNEWIEGEEWWNGQAITPVEPGYDAASNTYDVFTREEFAWLPEHIDEMLDAHPNFTLRLNNDIDMSGIEWKPIYPNSSARIYTVDGQGHALRNFSMSGAYGAIYEYKLGPFVLGRYEAYTGVWGKFDGVMKNLTFENITINGLADAEFPVKDEDGNPVDHSKEYAYFAGCIGYTGGNQWSMESQFENVHARHVQIKSSATSQNLGGLIGWVGSGGGDPGSRVAALKDCSAEDIHLTGYQAGGLVGQVLGDRGVSFDNCRTEDIYIRYSYISASSGFIGNIGDGGINISWSAALEINNCTPASNVRYINDQDGGINTSYQPQSPYYGHKNDVDKVTITPEP